MKVDELIEKHEKYLWGTSHYYKRPISIARGEGLYLWDTEGNSYLDMFGAFITMSVGHCHPRVTEAIVKQVQTLTNTPYIYPHENVVLYAEKLAEITPPGLIKSYFGVTGTDATENAIKLAIQYTGNNEFISLRNGYHGSSLFAVYLSGVPGRRPGGFIPPGIHHTPAPYCYRCPYRLTYPSCDLICAYEVEEIIVHSTSGKIAAFIAEPIMGIFGYVTPPSGYYKIVAEIVRKYGGLFIADEIQTMFGRTGNFWYGYAHHEIVPDIMNCGKSITSGLPMSATVTTPEIADSLRFQISSTYRQHPVMLAAALAVLDVIKEEAPPSHVGEIGAYIRAGFENLAEKYQVIGDIRGKGCVQGVEFVKDRVTKEPADQFTLQLMEETRKRGLLIGHGQPKNVIRFTPPLIAQKEHVDLAMDILDHSIAATLDAIGF